MRTYCRKIRCGAMTELATSAHLGRLCANTFQLGSDFDCANPPFTKVPSLWDFRIVIDFMENVSD
jgi:hypothetical protein